MSERYRWKYQKTTKNIVTDIDGYRWEISKIKHMSDQTKNNNY